MAWFRRGNAVLAPRVPDGPLRRFLHSTPPGRDTPLEELRLLAIDLETTGLDVDSDRILSIGFVPVDGREIRLDGAREIVVRAGSGQDVGDSATVHGLTDDVVTAARPPAEVLAELLAALRGQVFGGPGAEKVVPLVPREKAA